MCSSDLPWCQQLAPLVDDAAKAEGLDKIYYLDIRHARETNVGRYDSEDREDSRSSREDIRRDSGRIQEKTGGLLVTYHEFKERYMREAVTPEGAVKLYFDAVFCYIDPAARTEGVKMLRYCLREKRDWEKTA